jgi:hypothetical protein
MGDDRFINQVIGRLMPLRTAQQICGPSNYLELLRHSLYLTRIQSNPEKREKCAFSLKEYTAADIITNHYLTHARKQKGRRKSAKRASGAVLAQQGNRVAVDPVVT